MNQSSRFAHKDSGIVHVSRVEGFPVAFILNGIDLGFGQHAFAPVPGGDEAVPERPAAEFLSGPLIIADHVNHRCLDRCITVRRCDCLLKSQRRSRFGTGDQARADQHAFGAENQGCGEPAPVGDAARRDEDRAGRSLGEKVGDFGNERKSGTVSTMAACLAALRDNHIRTGVNGLAGVGHRLHLADHRHSGFLDAPGKRCWRSE